jgi:hypothetical protein
MGEANVVDGRVEKCLSDSIQKNLEESNHLKDFDIDWRIILKWILKK